MDKPQPLQRKTMTLDQLQSNTLKLIRKVRKHLRKLHWQEGMTDEEFIDWAEELETRIKQDRAILRKAEQDANNLSNPATNPCR